MKVLGQGATRMICPLLRQEETTVVVGETTIRQGVAEIVLTLHRQEETETARALRHLRLGGRRRALADKSPGNPGLHRTSPVPVGITGCSIQQTHVIASMTSTLEKKTLISAPCALVQLFAMCRSLGT